MKKWIPWLLVGVFALELLAALRPKQDKPGTFAANEFGRLPVLLNGRVQPLDSVGRNALLVLRGTASVPLEGNGANGAWGAFDQLAKDGGMTERKWYQFGKHPRRLKPSAWILEVLCNPAVADTRHAFLVHHPDLLGQLSLQEKGVERSGLRFYTFNDLAPHLLLIEKEARHIGTTTKQEHRNTYQKSVMSLHRSLQVYLGLKNSLKPERATDFEREIGTLGRIMGEGYAAVQKQQAGQDYNKEIFERFLALVEPYANIAQQVKMAQQMSLQQGFPFLVPPWSSSHKSDDWQHVSASLMDAVRSGDIHPAIGHYAAMSSAFGAGNVAEFNRHVAGYKAWLAKSFEPELKKGRQESYFHGYLPFYRSMIIYVFALLLAAASWLNFSPTLNQAAFWLTGLAFLVHTSGLVFRMYLEWRPPVTNLYSSAIFVGWGAVMLGLFLERLWRNGIGSFTASAIGFVTLIIAHHLSVDGDTMEMMRAVLDTNFWLATHVTTITIGYSSTFLAGFLAMVYLLRGVLTTSLDNELAKSLARMVYGIVCFATLFSFVGTILGGIWADQSWGRFWGWDPKENGALLIVLWNATILHAKWGGYIKERGLMNMALVGNIVTAWSWFGVNMLGIGLHSYGFMDAAFKWLMTFNATQLLLIALGSLPLKYWRSFRAGCAGGT
ncbi:MAG: cytochrome C biogenesis protein [Verrucomicrobia bacterium]|nr:cytochrome C biogenesis protein [Verrucomicrobiota bacterium]